MSAQLSVRHFNQLDSASASLETTTTIIVFELPSTSRELCGRDFMRSHKGCIWWTPELGWCSHVGVAVQYSFPALQRSRVDQSNKYSTAVILFSVYGRVSLWDMGGSVMFILFGPSGGTQHNTQHSAVWIDFPIDSEGEQGKVEAFLVGRRKVRTSC